MVERCIEWKRGDCFLPELVVAHYVIGSQRIPFCIKHSLKPFAIKKVLKIIKFKGKIPVKLVYTKEGRQILKILRIKP